MELKGKRILVTGSDGFIGSHLVERLIDEGAHVRAFVLYNSFNSWGWLDTFPSGLLENVEIFCGDVRDPNGVRKAVESMDVVFHLASLIGIPFSYYSPDMYVDTNIKGTLNVLQACRDISVEKVIVTSTSEVYGTARYVPIDEKHPLQGQSPYSATKIGADKIAESFYRAFDLPVVIARPFNTFGPRQSARAVIPTVITQLLSGKTEISLGSLHPTRDMNYVEDVCEGFAALAKCDNAFGREVNICSGSEISIGGLSQMICGMINPEAVIKTDENRTRPEKSEVERLIGDNSLIKELTGWQPAYDLKQGLHRTIEWFRQNENIGKYKAGIYNV